MRPGRYIDGWQLVSRAGRGSTTERWTEAMSQSPTREELRPMGHELSIPTRIRSAPPSVLSLIDEPERHNSFMSDHIFAVDDDPSMLRLITAFLKTDGFRVAAFESPIAA